MNDKKLTKEQLEIIKLLNKHPMMTRSKLGKRIKLKNPKNFKRSTKRFKSGFKRQLCGAGKTNYKGMKKS